MIEGSHANGNFEAAYKYIQLMEERNIALSPYIESDILSEIYRAVGVTPGEKKKRASMEAKQDVRSDASDVGDEIDEVSPPMTVWLSLSQNI